MPLPVDSASGLLTKYLNEAQKTLIVQELLSQLDHSKTDSDTIQTLSDLLNKNDFANVKKQVFPAVKSYCFDTLARRSTIGQDEEGTIDDLSIDNIILLCDTFTELKGEVIELLTTKISIYLSESSLFAEEMAAQREFNAIAASLQRLSLEGPQLPVPSKHEVSLYLSFLEKILSRTDTDATGSDFIKKINVLACIYTTLGDEVISSIAANIFRWTIDSLAGDRELDTLVWNTTFFLVSSPAAHKYHNRNGYMLWIRYLHSASKLQVLNDSAVFKSLIKQRNYWDILQQLLVSQLHEHRKYALSILQFTVQSITESFDNGVMRWDVSQSEMYIKEWKRFCVLYEVTGIDTSLHQIEAGYQGIQRLLDPKVSKIPSSWGLCLISTAIAAAMDSVRKYALDFVLSIDKLNLEIFDKNSTFFLKNVFLNFAMQASLFSVSKEDARSVETCPYGERLAQFVADIFKALQKANKIDSIPIVAGAILDKLVETRFGFDYARIYVTMGLCQGLKSVPNVLDTSFLPLLDKLCQNASENEVLENFLQKLHIRLLLHIDSKKVSLKQLIAAIGKLVIFNNGKPSDIVGNYGYSLFDDDLEHILDFISTSYPKDELHDLVLAGDNINANFSNVETLTVAICLLVSREDAGTVTDAIYTDLEKVILKRSVFPLLLTELTFSKLSGLDVLFQKLSPYYLKLAEELSNNLIKHKGIWSKGYSIVSSSEIFPEDDENLWESNINLKKLWVSIAVEFQSIRAEVAELAVRKLRFFSCCFAKMKYLVEEEDVEDIAPEDRIWGLRSFEQIEKMASYLFKNLPSNLVNRKLRDEALSSLFDIVREFMLVHLQTPELNSAALKLVRKYLPVTEFRGQLAAVKLLLAGLLNNHNGIQLSATEIKEIIEILKQAWVAICLDRLKLNQQELHLNFVDLLFDSKILSLCCREESTQQDFIDDILTIGYDIIEQSYGRRSLLPKMASKLLGFQIEHPEHFANCEFLGPILIKIFSFVRLNTNAFKLIEIAGRLYDKFINFSTGNIYEQIYGPTEDASRIRTIVAIASLPKSSKLAIHIFNHIIDNSRTEYHLFSPVKRVDGGQEWSRIQLYSILIVLVRVLDEDARSLAAIAEEHFIPALSKDASPIVRVYLEWLIGLIYASDAALVDFIFDKVAESDMTPSILMCYERIAFLITQQLDRKLKSRYLKKLIAHLVSYCTSNKVSLRHFSASLICCVKNEIIDRDPHLEVSAAEREIVIGIYNSVTLHGKIDEYRSGDAILWDLRCDISLVGVCGGVLLRVSDRQEINFITERQFRRYMVAAPATQKQLQLQQRKLIESRLQVPVGTDDETVWLSSLKQAKHGNPGAAHAASAAVTKGKRTGASEADKIALQKKSGAWRTVMDLDGTSSSATPASSIKRSKLIVMGSLVDKPPNLGGICRLCDVLGAGLLTLGDIKYKAHHQFRSVAVTADLWLPMQEVRPEGIVAYLREQKRHGYSLIGLEQTDKSVPLDHELKFPEKSLIVLGKEKEGIPGDILAELDFCVEIKQVGVVRSMNIQTATALIVHAYSLQYC